MTKCNKISREIPVQNNVKEEVLTLWMNNTGLIIQVEKIFQDFNSNLVWTFVTYKVTGSVKNYLQTLSQAQIEYLLKDKTTNSLTHHMVLRVCRLDCHHCRRFRFLS